ncbi:class I SAM-dependent methyltransferase [Arenibacter sp. GZD96]|uniref:class I SAM-dependent methyltransferase n=1 Tax=Aurantibrevibacter litoralis TaxID=3106030 RepID=UPI002AFE5F9D|nr:class I SAM-dependent methyltransferase [Arenibacter sp. GZD-96]MEA1786467.1 class I SAM-dependent methyltransferase [Arenibacter sp. GZD-96]
MKLYLRTKDFAVTQEDFELWQDPDNDMLMTKPVPKVIEPYYQSETYISHTDASKSVLEKAYQFAKKINLKRKMTLLRRYVKGDLSVLDIGAGTGDFLVTAKKEGWVIAGVEPNEGAREKALQKGVTLASHTEAIGYRKYNCITLWHVLEHLPNLEAQLTKIVSSLKIGGTLVVAVPNYKSFDAQFYGSFWAGYDTPRHLWHFSRTAIERKFKSHGMEVISVKPMWLDAFYVALLSEKYKTGKSNYLNAFWIGIKSNIKGWYTGEFSSHIYILKHQKMD